MATIYIVPRVKDAPEVTIPKGAKFPILLQSIDPLDKGKERWEDRRNEMMDMEWTIPEVKDEYQYKASDNISDGELIERDCYRSKDESKELEEIKKNHSETQEKEKVAEVPPYPRYFLNTDKGLFS